MTKASRLVAHRGEMRYFPENTLPALQAAIQAGAKHLEFDIQFSHDRMPMLFHDFTLKRTTGLKDTIADYFATDLEKITVLPSPHAHCKGTTTTIPTLSHAIELLNQSPDISVFVELKRHSIEHFDIKDCVDRVINTMTAARFMWTLISFSEAALQYAYQHHGIRIGWVLRAYNDESRKTADGLSPGFVFCNLTKLHRYPMPLWIGPWRWVLYDTNDPKLASSLLNQGVNLIETGCITDMLQSPVFRKSETNRQQDR